ncbi:hypothetical protein SAMN04488570_1731 [Nocardioides scoriae]|uniref:Transcriptional regulator, AbiEi antitoxin, Type IV TA system n=1 Tax=Nocardioides scoriae TaxID=642780 RepID=A0A1H1RN29_9ACTN|nr:type IV toxin-antitoxin system AbiEi family antitoxin domain-containing protein [Nocardioides scoriae]SDS37052.1 hypothetical protein SAMN04488570_1731 [Nocardioides scoriae]
MPDERADLLCRQDGVVTREQLRALGAGEHDIRRWLRRRDLVVVHPGVYVDHTGPLTWRQRAWAATLAVGPAALHGVSALRAAHGVVRPGGREDGPIHVAVEHDRRVRPPEGVVLHRTRGLGGRVRWSASPPCVRPEEAVLDVAAEARDDHTAVAVLADAVQSRVTTTSRLQQALAGRPRMARRHFVGEVLADVGTGACSVLERAYLVDVERAHRLPRGDRQAPTVVGRPGARDVTYRTRGLVVELDGRLGHSTAADRDRDLQRDLDAAACADLRTVRLGWGQVLGRPCATAGLVATLLGSSVTPCPRCSTTGRTAATG